MSRSELVYQLAQAGAAGDRAALERTMDLLVTEAQQEGRHTQARRLSGVMREGKPHRETRRAPVHGLPETVRDLLIDRQPRRALNDLILPDAVVEDVREFVIEQEHAALLRANSLEPRHAVMLVGPPGNGKTSLAEAMAFELGLPFLTVRYDAVIDSFLGETAARIRRVVEYAAAAPCLLFFDEFDAIGKERGDVHETGEIKRVVSSLLVQLETLPTHCVVVCATNHPELLDRAAWRRFELRIEVPKPGLAEIARMFDRLIANFGDLGFARSDYLQRMADLSFSEIEQFNLDVKRRLVLSKGKLKPAEALRTVLDRWTRRLAPPAPMTEYHGETADRTIPAPVRRTKKDQRISAASVSEEDRLPGTG